MVKSIINNKPFKLCDWTAEPISESEKSFKVPNIYGKFYGNFTDPGCALSYLSQKHSSEEVFKKVATILSESLKSEKKGLKIEPAPTYLLLKRFGGDLSVDAFYKRYNHLAQVADFVQEIPVTATAKSPPKKKWTKTIVPVTGSESVIEEVEVPKNYKSWERFLRSFGNGRKVEVSFPDKKCNFFSLGTSGDEAFNKRGTSYLEGNACFGSQTFYHKRPLSIRHKRKFSELEKKEANEAVKSIPDVGTIQQEEENCSVEKASPHRCSNRKKSPAKGRSPKKQKVQ